MALKDYLPDFKGALNSFYDERLKETIDSKSTEYKEFFNTKSAEYQELLKENFAYSKRTQQILIAVAIGIFLLLCIAYFWKE